MRFYEGHRSGNQIRVTVNGEDLQPRFHLWVHTLDGFEWGHCGSGAEQLALALLADHLTDEKLAVALCQPFLEVIVAKLPAAHWQLCSAEIDKALEVLSPGRVP
jgi:hypothetical protein